jgi:hypothetical protein
MMLQHSAAMDAFTSKDARIRLENFPVRANETATLELERSRPVFDANTEFYTHTKQGKVPFRVRPVQSYHGTVNGDPNTFVTLHYADGDMTGFIQFANGQRTVVGRDYAVARSAEATAHVIADEATMLGHDPLTRFLCGNESLPVDHEAMARKMSTPAVAKGAEQVQEDYFREFKMAVVLREDIDSTMKRRGQTDEEIAQYFVKIIAAMAQVYEQELNALLYITYFEKFTEDEPSGYFYDGRSPSELLNEFSLDWSNRMGSVDRTVAHLYALIRPVGGSFVGGVAYLDQLCNKRHRGGYGISTVYLNADPIPGDPNRNNAFVWDVFVGAHEMGHNVGAPHTHTCYWSPPVDTCQVQSDIGDACFSNPALRRAVLGTIMSYCHLINGSRTPLTFGDKVAERMRGWVATTACAPPITRPTVRLTEPRGPDSYTVNETMTIRWASARIANVKLLWGTSETGPWTTFAESVDAAERIYRWNVPAIPASQFWVRIEDATNPDVHDTSLASYRVSVPVTLDAPKGGERLGQGRAFTIRWTKATGIGNVKVEFAPDGTTWETLQDNASGNTLAWTVPSIATENARIRVSALSAPGTPSTSGAFAIGVPRFALEIPAENSFICKNQPNQYRWSADFIPTIRIQYSTDNGANWRQATQQVLIETSQWQIFSRNVNMNSVPAGTMLKLRVLDGQTDEVLDTRESIRMDSCDAPVSVNERSADVPFAITGVTPNPASSVVRLALGSASNRTVDVVLVSADGRESVLLRGYALMAGMNALELSVDGVAAGGYRLVVRDGSAQMAAPLMITR